MGMPLPPNPGHVEIMESCKNKKLVKVLLEKTTLDLYFEDGSCITITSRSMEARGASRLIVERSS